MRTRLFGALLAIACLIGLIGISTPAGAVDGATLYGQYCAACHGPLASSTKAGRTAVQIQNAINTVGAMSSLKSSLTAADVAAIAAALAPTPPPSTPPPTPPPSTPPPSNPPDGAALYNQNCAGCHGPLASSTKAGRTAAQIQNAINTVGAMSSLNTLTAAEIAAIAAALPATPPPSTPPPSNPPPSTPPPTPPSNPGAAMALPDGRHVYTYGPTEAPLLDSDPSQARPISLGAIAAGGNTVDINVQVGPFSGPVDVSFGVYDATFNADDIYFIDVTNQFITLSNAVAQNSRDSQDADSRGDNKGKKKFKNLVTWKTNVLEVNEHVLGPIPVTDLSPGLYVLHLAVSPASSGGDDNSGKENYYRWVTYFIVP